MEPLFRKTWDAAALMEQHPPRWQHPYKKLAAALTCPAETVHQGTIEVTRWPALSLPELLPVHSPFIEAHPEYFGYEPSDTAEWYLNFADRSLFGYYGGPLLAQDELQVLEHPALGAVREALLSEKLPALTVEGGKPTPVLVRGVERRGALDTSTLYGNRFAASTPEKIRAALTVLTPPTASNILAVEAIPGGHGFYKLREIEYTLRTAYTGFAAAKAESTGRVTIHTGFWGCGAYGGNRTLMVLLQLLAAKLAGIERIIFHTGDIASLTLITDAETTLSQLATDSLPDTLLAIQEKGYRWGVSDGN